MIKSCIQNNINSCVLHDRSIYYMYRLNEFFERKCVRIIGKKHALKIEPTKFEEFLLKKVYSPAEFKIRNFRLLILKKRKDAGKAYLPKSLLKEKIHYSWEFSNRFIHIWQQVIE